MAGQNYRDLAVWQKAMQFAKIVYDLTSRFPSEEKFGLTSQLRRAVVSIPSNIAEGQGRLSDAEFVRFLSIAHGSLRETETQLLLSVELGYLESSNIREVMSLAEEIGRMLNGLIRSLRQRITTKPQH